MKRLGALLSSALAVASVLQAGCGVFVMKSEYDKLAQKNDALEKDVASQKQDVVTLKTDLAATRERLDNALRANADTGSDILSSKARLNDLAGRLDEVSHANDELKANLQATRTELDGKLDALTRAQTAVVAVQPQAVQPQAVPPPVKIPADKATHFASVEGAYRQRDWGLVRTLGHEFENRYGADDKTDDVLYLMGDADLQDSKPTSALGEFNRLLKLFPRSDRLDAVLFDMGEAYMQLHDCANAKLAFTSCQQRYGKSKYGMEAKARLAQIDKPTAGMCAPQ